MLETRSLLERLVSIGEAVAGTEEARRLAEEAGRLLEEATGVSVEQLKLPVATWRDEGGVVECGGLRVDARVLPQTLGGVAEGRLVEVHCTQPTCFTHVSRGDVVIARLPEDPDDVTTIYVNALEAGAEALIVYDRWPGRYRRIVVSGRWDYARLPSPAPMPAVHVRLEDGLKLVKHCIGSRVRLDSRASIRWSTGAILEARIGEGDREALVIAHYDHWLTGAGDNLAGVAALIRAARLLRSLSLGGVAVRLALLDAEEFGDPMLPAWYWAYGSRWYARMLNKTHLLDDIVLVVNLEMPVRRRLYAAGTPEARGLVASIARRLGVEVVEEEYETCYSDGYNFARLGAPSVTLYNIEDYLEWYHTDADLPTVVDLEAIEAAAKAAFEAIRRLAEDGLRALDYRGYIEALEGLETLLPLQARRGVYVFTEEARKALDEGRVEALHRALRFLNARLGACVFHDDYRWGSGGFKPLLMPWLRVALEEARMVRERRFGGGDAVIPGSEEKLPVATPMPVKLWAGGRVERLGGWWGIVERAFREAVVAEAERVDEILWGAYELLRASR